VDERLDRSRRRAHVVVVDDEQALASFIDDWLARHGLETIPIGSGGRRHRFAGASAALPALVPLDSDHPHDVRPNPSPAGRGRTLMIVTEQEAEPDLGMGPDDGSRHLGVGPVLIDLARHSVRVMGSEVHLTPTEFRLLYYLVEHADRVISHRELLLSVWGRGYEEDDHSLQVTIRSLRTRIAQATDHQLIDTVYGVGYRIASSRQYEAGPAEDEGTRGATVARAQAD
jgi:DNA-binding response OmpR family regulator